MNTCLALMAHQQAEPTLREFWPAWKSLGVPIIAFLPCGDAWPIPELPDEIIHDGKSAHRGPAAFQRLVGCFHWLWSSRFDAYVIIEPDCLPMRAELPSIVPGEFRAWTCRIEGGRETYEFCALPPWTMDKTALARVLGYIIGSGDHYLSHPDCGEFTDRWLLKVAANSGVTINMLNEVLGYARCDNSIDLIKRNKPSWVHGFKRREQFKDAWPNP